MWLAVNKFGRECVFNEQPLRYDYVDQIASDLNIHKRIFMPEGAIEKLIGKKLTWSDEPFNYDAYVVSSK